VLYSVLISVNTLLVILKEALLTIIYRHISIKI